MAGTDPVTWDELDNFCKGHQGECQRLRESQGQTANVKIETALKNMADQIEALKTLLDSKLYVLPKPILYMLLGGAICAGLAGREAISLVTKHFGGG
jgi:hypothetical protein